LVLQARQGTQGLVQHGDACLAVLAWSLAERLVCPENLNWRMVSSLARVSERPPSPPLLLPPPQSQQSEQSEAKVSTKRDASNSNAARSITSVEWLPLRQGVGMRVTNYAADQLRGALLDPNRKLDMVNQSVRRKYCLIADALGGLSAVQWRINDEPKMRSAELDEFLGLERFAHGFCVYSSERGFRQMLAIFHSIHLAADYFVWIVSNGQCTIDWTKFLEIEP
jgi:hypothetical protein